MLFMFCVLYGLIFTASMKGHKKHTTETNVWFLILTKKKIKVKE